MRSCLASEQILIMTESFAEVEPTACLSQCSAKRSTAKGSTFATFLTERTEGCESATVITLCFTIHIPTKI